MNSKNHVTANANHYDKEAQNYDAFNAKNSEIINKFILAKMEQYSCKKVLDLTCGTGSQVFALHEQNYRVTGADINLAMLTIAQTKAAKADARIKFFQGDMRTLQIGKFNAVLTIFNSIGHLTKEDFQKTLKNIHSQLSENGIYIFDIFNLNYFLAADNITKLTIDWQKKLDTKTIREIQYSTINTQGILASYDIYHEQEAQNEPKVSQAVQTLQIYNAKQIKDLLTKNKFSILEICNPDGSEFLETSSERMVVVAQKR